MNTPSLFLIVFIIIILLWSLVGYFSSRVETSEYTVLERKNGYELRNYPAHIVAETTVEGSYDEALHQGFRIIASYIFGGNKKKESFAMTSPATETTSSSEKIAMTAPVTASIDGTSRTIAFGMPKSYTLETLPIPNDSRIRLITVPEKKMAVLTFSWMRNASQVEKKKEELLDLLKKDGITTVGSVIYAGYNAPWTPPWMLRNEVMVEAK